MVYIFSFGVVLGLSAGVTPGPLLTLVISETLQYGTRQGIKVALAPVISDLPIVLLIAFLLYGIKQFDIVMGGIAFLGAAYIFYMGWENFKAKPVLLDNSDKRSKSLVKGVLANILNPSPYLFWLSVGLPTISKAMETGVHLVVLFVISFYGCLVGSKIGISVIIGKSRAFLTGKLYKTILRLIGLALWALALVLLKEGLVSFGLMG